MLWILTECGWSEDIDCKVVLKRYGFSVYIRYLAFLLSLLIPSIVDSLVSVRVQFSMQLHPMLVKTILILHFLHRFLNHLR